MELFLRTGTALTDVAPFLPSKTRFIILDVAWPWLVSDVCIALALILFPVVLLRTFKRHASRSFKYLLWAFALFLSTLGASLLAQNLLPADIATSMVAILKILAALAALATIILLVVKFPAMSNQQKLSKLENVNKSLRAEVAQRLIAEQKFQTILNNSVQFMGLMQPDGTLIEVNDTALKFGTYASEKEVIGKKFWDTKWWDHSLADRAKLKDAVQAAANGKFIRYDAEVIGGNNELAIIDFTIRPVTDNQGNVYLLIPEGRDITQKHRLEQELNKARVHYENLFSTVGDGIVFQNQQGEIIEANKAAEKILGMSLDEMRGVKSVDPRWKSVHEDGTPYPGLEHPPMQAIQSGKPYLNKIMGVFHPKKNDMSWIRASGYPLKDEHGNVTGAYSTFQDITEEYRSKKLLEHSETRFQLAVEGSMAGVWDLDLEQDNLWFSERVYELLGYADKEIDFTAHRFGQLIHPAERQITKTKLDNHLQYRTPYALEYRLKHKTNGYKWYSASGQATWNDKGEPVRMVGAIIDIDELKRTVASLKTTSEKLRLKVDELEQFTYIASHDLQEPVRAIESLVALFRQTYADKLDDERMQYLKHMEECSKRSSKLVTDLLCYGRIGSEPIEKDIDLNELMHEATLELNRQIEKKGARIQVQPLPTVPAAKVDMKLVFRSLISNALKFSKPDVPPTINITYQRKNDKHIISFADNGIGIDNKYFDRIFIVFKRLHGRQEYHGTGIGLAYCKKVMEQHEGTITVESEPDNGTTFHITLPAVD